MKTSKDFQKQRRERQAVKYMKRMEHLIKEFELKFLYWEKISPQKEMIIPLECRDGHQMNPGVRTETRTSEVIKNLVETKQTNVYRCEICKELMSKDQPEELQEFYKCSMPNC